MAKNIFKKLLPHLGAVLLFYVLSVGYFFPRVLEGKDLFQIDTRKGAAMAREANDYYEKTGERTLWTNSAFSGMPTYQITPSYKAKVIQNIRRFFEGGLPDPASYLFLFMTGFYILMLALKVNPWLAVIGSVAYAFSSYFISIIHAGHIWKVLVLGLIPPTFAGIILTMRGRYLLGGVVTALFLSLQIYNNHIQMTYYFFAFLVSLYMITQTIDAYRSKSWPGYLKSVGVLFAAGIIAIGVNITNLYTTATYTQHTTRGPSVLSENTENQTAGLDRDYVTQWSYGVGETFSLLIPNIRGGGNGYLGEDANVMAKINSPMKQYVAESDRYWGEQPSLSAPSYAGALILFLAVLGFIFMKGNSLRWALAIAAIWSIMMSWGHNFMFLTNLFLDYFPMYNKFRAPSMAMVVAEMVFPILAVLGLKKIIEDPGIIKKEKRSLYIAFGLTGGLSLLFAIIPDAFFSFLNSREIAAYMGNAAQNSQEAEAIKLFLSDLTTVRKALLTSDAFRSFLFITAGAGLIWLFGRQKINARVLTVSILALVLVDLWTVDKRYLNTEINSPYGKQWVTKKEKNTAVWPKTIADDIILRDTTSHFRVFNLTVSPFNDASTSWWHKSIGGYHGAKLGRYQDLADHYLGKMDITVLNMLNAKYFIVPGNDKSPEAPSKPEAQLNPGALGNAWFVSEISFAGSNDEEFAALKGLNPANTAIINEEFRAGINTASFGRDSLSGISLTEYAPNRMKYHSSNSHNGMAVFSEIWYPDGWLAYIDGEPASILRANYALRALAIPAGEHTVEFTFYPQSYIVCERVSVGFVSLLFMGIAVSLVIGVGRLRKL